MLSAATLERVSLSYKRGYRAGYAGQSDQDPKGPHGMDRPFADFDFSEGFKAGANDRKWADHYATRNSNK